ncbi:MAG: radical SAM protein [bacterium]|nr:radical SAM protein [bacterium]
MIKNKIKYNAWLHWHITPRCNLHCKYCFFNPNSKNKNGKHFFMDRLKNLRIKLILPILWSFTEGILKGDYDMLKIMEYLSKKIDCNRQSLINTESLLRVLDNTNKIFRISFTGGEPFLISNIVEACKKITKKHYLSFNTNLTSDRIKDFACKINPKKTAFIVASLHIKELERLNLLEKYIENFRLLKKKGFNIHAIAVAHPSLLKEVDDYKNYFLKKGIKIKFDPFIGEFNGKFYPGSYSNEELCMIGIEKSHLNKYVRTNVLCNAGYNAAVVDSEGTVVSCYAIREYLGNIYKKIEFKKNLLKCNLKVCNCPLYAYDKDLYELALKEQLNDKLR